MRKNEKKNKKIISMEISLEENIIIVKAKKITEEGIIEFFKKYKELFERMDVEKNKTLRLIEEPGFNISNRELLMKFTMILYTKFKKMHEEHIKNIEFILNTQSFYYIFRGILLIFPPRHPYKIIHKNR